MSLDSEGMTQITVIQGDICVSDDPTTIFSTLLGSCISVCLFDEKVSAGGMNHFLLPGENRGDSSNLRYGVNSMELLINGLIKLGASRSSMKAKVFGAGAIADNLNIGESNGEFAMRYLQEEKIEVLSSSLGGTFARRIRFHPNTGQARQLLVPSEPKDFAEVAAPKPQPAAAEEIELF